MPNNEFPYVNVPIDAVKGAIDGYIRATAEAYVAVYAKRNIEQPVKDYLRDNGREFVKKYINDIILPALLTLSLSLTILPRHTRGRAHGCACHAQKMSIRSFLRSEICGYFSLFERNVFVNLLVYQCISYKYSFIQKNINITYRENIYTPYIKLEIKMSV